ncbi:hypothetical protein RHGRI_028731 [Rhododendron griersonianum]|uniref:Uncharacterized protein n=1 Tax=Rhododendron griersonianum TaxID=479676 RepID=A0AAV6IMR8_9ERIC|nr:hypothetical protein RHGRI_028731 [Rhododendron griersonianum]
MLCVAESPAAGYFQFQFSTFNLLPNASNNDESQNPPTIQPPIDESHVLNQLSALLPIRRGTTVPEQLTVTSPYGQLEVKAVDGFLGTRRETQRHHSKRSMSPHSHEIVESGGISVPNFCQTENEATCSAIS